MTNRLRNLPWSVWVTVIVIGTVLLAGFVFDSKVSARYQGLVTNSDLVEAFEHNQDADVRSYAATNHLDYQLVVDRAVVSASSSDLPEPNFIRVTSAVSPTVIQRSASEELPSLRPYRLWLRGRYYIMFPIFEDSGTSGYLVYARVI